MHEADRVGGERRASAGRVAVSVPAVPVIVNMHVRVPVERASPPAHEQPDREGNDHEPDRRLGPSLDGLGQVGRVEDDRQPEGEERRRMAQTPDEAEPAGRPPGVVVTGSDQRRHGREVIWVGCVAQTKQGCDGHHDQQRRAVGAPRDPFVESRHVGRSRFDSRPGPG